MRFEDVLADPGTRFMEMREFAGLPASPVFEQALARTRFDPDRADAFRRALGRATVPMLDASLAEHLRQWGY